MPLLLSLALLLEAEAKRVTDHGDWETDVRGGHPFYSRERYGIA
jgi:hypothetical protein